uniref:Uncharacterized protein n=1 Tax=Globisporangium ultimum (strain ATCC 200006 / CBS 805.95 / DAOM BR144) TaxID=431595 RepID=K3WCH9_GLOUD
MSREERKMAQIIASIERMEQRKASVRADSNGESDGNTSSSAASSGSRVLPIQRMNSTEIHAQVQKSTRLGAKGKKLKPLSTSHGGVKVKSSKKAKTPQELIVRKKEIIECKLTPKKRWILAWNEQLSATDEMNEVENKASEPEQEPSREKLSLGQVLNAPDQVEQKVSQESKPTRPAIVDEPVKEEGEDGEIEDEEGAVKMAESEGIALLLSPAADGQKESSISPVAAMKETLKDTPVSRVAVDKKEVQKGNLSKVKDAEKISASVMPSEPTKQREPSAAAISSDSDDSKKSAAKKLTSTNPANSSASLRVKTPQITESSHLSPPLDRNSPTPAASISPSSKTKDAESTTNAEASLPSTEKTPLSAASPKKDEVKTNPIPAIARKDSTESLGSRRDEARSRKRSLERKESEPLTEEEKRRAERRRKRKSNWDVGDPRLASRNPDKQVGRSPSSDGNHTSSRFPSGRPAWRHSSSMDATHTSSSKPSFQNASSHRASFSGGSSSSRRGFYSSNSLPLDRSRSAGRPASRYHYNNSYR